MKRLFISQPMRGKTDEEILEVRDRAVRNVEELLGEKVTVIDSFIQNTQADTNPLWYLCKSLEFLSTADIAYFVGDWENYRGCRVERICASEYGIAIIEDYGNVTYANSIII